MKKAMLTILLALPFVLIFIISLSSKIITTYSEVEIESISFINEDNEEIDKLILQPESENQKLNYVLYPALTTQTQVNIYVADESIITIDEQGFITVLKEGLTTVTVKSRLKDVSNTIYVEVKQSLPTDLIVNVDNIDIKEGNTFNIEYQILPASASNKQVTFSVEDPSICSITSMGVVKGLKSGSTKVTITTEEGIEGPISKEITINVIENTDRIFIEYTSGELFKVDCDGDKATVDLYDYIHSVIDRNLISFEIVTGSRNGSLEGNLLTINKGKIIEIKAIYQGEEEKVKFTTK